MPAFCSVIPAKAGTPAPHKLQFDAIVQNHAVVDRARCSMPYRDRSPCVYILASRRNGTLYVGVTSDLPQRINLHKQDLIEGFTKKYRVHLLVYYETHHTMDDAIHREKQIKEWRRLWKIRLIESMNPEWIDLFDEATGEILDGPADTARRTW
jgi:putative endonuclease